MPARACAQCGVKLNFPDRPGRPRTKCEDCSPRRKRDERRRAPKVVALPDPPPVDELPDLEAVASLMAQRLASPETPPSAVAALAREYRATLAEIEKSRPKAKDGIDEIAERRARRGAG